MAYKALTVEELLDLMKKIQGKKTHTEFAGELGISKQYLCDIYNGRKVPSGTISTALGFQAKTQTVYVPTATAAKAEATSENKSKSQTTRSRKRHS